MTTRRDYLERMKHFRTIDAGLRNLAPSLHDHLEHLESQGNETLLPDLPENGEENYLAGNMSADAREFALRPDIQVILNLRLKALDACRAAWHELNSDRRIGLDPPP